MISKDDKISAKRKIVKDEELFLDCNRDVLCSHCNKENCFSENSLNVGDKGLLMVFVMTAEKLDHATNIVPYVAGIFAPSVTIIARLVNYFIIKPNFDFIKDF